MRLPSPLLPGRLIKRYKRFLADIRLDDGREATAHCANPGSMLGVAIEGSRVWVHEHGDRKRKLAFSWELVEIGGTLIPVNTTNPNRIAAEAIEKGVIPELTGYGEIAREVKYGEASRIDLLLSGGFAHAPRGHQRIAPAADLDPAYAKALQTAAAAGVELLCYDCEVTSTEVVLRKPLEIDLEPK